MAMSASLSFAQTKIATVDLETVIQSHPKTEENTKILSDMQKESMAKRDTAGEKLDALRKELSDMSEKASNSAMSDKAREAAKTQARDILSKMRTEEESYTALVRQLQKSLNETELVLFEATMKDVNDKIGDIAKERKVDMVIDSSAARPGAPVSVVLWSNPSLDITEEVVKKLGGKITKKRSK